MQYSTLQYSKYSKKNKVNFSYVLALALALFLVLPIALWSVKYNISCDTAHFHPPFFAALSNSISDHVGLFLAIIDLEFTFD